MDPSNAVLALFRPQFSEAAGPILAQLFPLILLVALGFVAGKLLGMNRESLAPLLVYILAPLTIFKGLVEAQLSPQFFALPFLYIGLATLVGMLTWRLGGLFFQSPARNVLAYAGGNCNSGYFGFPAAVALLGNEAFPVIVMISFGFVIFEATYGFYITARSHYTPKDSLLKLARLPVLYVFVVGLICNSSGLEFSTGMHNFFDWIKGSFVALGMMLIGIGLADFKRGLHADWKFMSFAFFTKFIVWPAATAVFLFAWNLVTPVDPLISKVVILTAFLPMAANVVAFASLLKAEPEKIALATTLSTLLAVLLIPFLSAFL